MINVKKYSPDYSSIINEGGFGDIYKCKENNNFVIKMTKNIEDQYNGECNKKIIKKLFYHKNLVKILGIDKNRYKDIYLIYMEYIDGLTLTQYTNNYKLSNNIILSIIKQTLSALNFLHQNKITHRDIKLDNIIISKKNYNIKIVDFGLAYYGFPCKNLVGTSGYFAPEMLYNINNYNSKCDIWSLGCVLYYLVCNYFPFILCNNREYYIQQLNNKININYDTKIWNHKVILKLCKNMLVYCNNLRYDAKKLLELI